MLPENSVGTAQLKKKAVTGAKLKKNAVTVVGQGPVLNAGEHATATASCPAGKKVLGGGPQFDAGLEINESYVSETEWKVVMRNPGPGSAGFSVVAYCAAVE